MLRFVTVKVLPDTHKGFLGGIFCQADVATHAVGQADNAVVVAADQFSKCLTITLLCAGDQIAVIHFKCPVRTGQVLVCLSIIYYEVRCDFIR